MPAVTYTISAKDNASKNVKNVQRSFEDMQRGAYKATESILSVEKAQLALGGVAAGFVLLKDVAQVAGRALEQFGQAAKFVIDSSVSLKTQSTAVQSSFVQLASALGDSIGQSEAMINVVDRLLLKMGEWQTDVVASEAQVQESVDFMLDVTQKLLIAGSYIYDTYNAVAAAIAAAYELAVKAATPLRIALDEDMPWWSKAKGMYDFLGPGAIATASRAWDAVGTEWDKASTRIKAGSKNADEFRASLRDLFSALKGAEEAGPTINMAPFDFGANKGGAAGKTGGTKTQAAGALDDSQKALLASQRQYQAMMLAMRAEATNDANDIAAEALRAEEAAAEASRKIQERALADQRRLDDERIEEARRAAQEQAAILGSLAAGTATALAVALGSGADMVDALFQQIGGALTQLGGTMTASGFAALLGGPAAALFGLNGPGMIAAGLGLTAAGAALQSGLIGGGGSSSSGGGSTVASGYQDTSSQRVQPAQSAAPLVYEIHQHFSGVYTSEAEAGRKIQDALVAANRGGTSSVRRATSRAT